MIYRHKHEGELPVYCIKHQDFSCYNYVFYITTTPYLPCNKNHTNTGRVLYDFYTLVTLTTRYITTYKSLTSALGFNPFTTAAIFVLRTADSAATAAAVLLVGTFVQSPIPNTLAAWAGQASHNTHTHYLRGREHHTIHTHTYSAWAGQASHNTHTLTISDMLESGLVNIDPT